MKPLLPLLVCCSISCRISQPTTVKANHPLVKEYLAATVISHEWSKSNHPPVKVWNYKLSLADGLNLKISATGWISGKFSGQYSDESAPRTIGNAVDYIYPCDLRIDSDNNYIYSLARGFLPIGGKDKVTILFQFDVHKRILVNTIHIAPNVLPDDPTAAP